MCVDNYINTYLDKNINIFRLSFGIYNTKKEIDIFFDVLEEFLKK
jgi:selenocysteine lyase/cysteine desulfurase